MRVGLVLVIIGAIAIVMGQNSTPTIPLVLFGASTAAFPVGLWLLLGIGSGLMTSLLIQGLTAQLPRQPQVAPRYREPSDRDAPRPRRPQMDWDESRDPDWDAADRPPGWDIETLPDEPTIPVPSKIKPVAPAKPPEDGVKDANYRVIEPPDPNRTAANVPNEENWDF